MFDIPCLTALSLLQGRAATGRVLRFSALFIGDTNACRVRMATKFDNTKLCAKASRVLRSGALKKSGALRTGGDACQVSVHIFHIVSVKGADYYLSLTAIADAMIELVEGNLVAKGSNLGLSWVVGFTFS